jgi:mono/diheme cytochrome c family protein
VTPGIDFAAGPFDFTHWTVDANERSTAAERPSSAETDTAEHAAHPPRQTQTTRTFMRKHSGDALAMRKAAIAGQLTQFQLAASNIASDEWSHQLRADYRSRVAVVRGAARAAFEATAIPAATAALAELGGACAACHQDVGGPPPPSIDATSTAAGDSMVAHAAAEEALWRGLVFPSDVSWRSGAEQLVNAPALDSDVVDVSALAHRTSDLAREAVAAPAEARGKLSGKILSTCSACHHGLGVEPK